MIPFPYAIFVGLLRGGEVEVHVSSPTLFLKRRGLFPNWTSSGRASYHVKKTGTTCTTNTELLLENHDTKPRFGNCADVSSSEEETADTVPGDVQTTEHSKVHESNSKVFSKERNHCLLWSVCGHQSVYRLWHLELRWVVWGEPAFGGGGGCLEGKWPLLGQCATLSWDCWWERLEESTPSCWRHTPWEGRTTWLRCLGLWSPFSTPGQIFSCWEVCQCPSSRWPVPGTWLVPSSLSVRYQRLE